MPAISACQAAAKASRSASCQCVCASASSAIAWRSIGRSRRTRRWTSPSSSIRLGAGTCTAARPDWALTQEPGAGVARPLKRLVEGERLVAVAACDREDPCLGAGLRMGVDRAPLGDREALGRQGLDAEVVGAGRDRPFDPRLQQTLEHAEQRVLQVDRQRQQAVEEGRDRRQILAQAAVIVGQPEARSRPRRLCNEQPSTLPP